MFLLKSLTISAIATGKAVTASSNLLNIIDRIPKIDNASSNGITPRDSKGNLSFQDIMFRYASRPKVREPEGKKMVLWRRKGHSCNPGINDNALGCLKYQMLL